MRYSPELAARAQAWLALPLAEKRAAAGLTELTSIWAAAQGLPSAPACRQCQYSDRVHDLNAYLREYARFPSPFSVMAENTTTAPATYQFKSEFAGQTLTDDAYGKAVTADNLTDEDAAHFIKRGFGHVFQKIGAAIESVGEQLEGVGDGLADDQDDDQPTEREQELQAQLEQSEQAYDTEVASHAATVEQLSLVGQAKEVAEAALVAEQQAHAATMADLATAQAILAALPPAQLQKATDKASGKATAPDTTDSTGTPAPTASPTGSQSSSAPAGDATQGNAPASSEATGSN